VTKGHEAGRRGSHATDSGQGFSWVLLWTILGALIPGAGLVAAGRRRLGGVVLFLLAAGLAALVALALVGNPLKRGLSLAVDPQALLIAAVAAGVVGLLWAAIILLTNQGLRRHATLDSGQRAFSGVVVLALIGGVALPAFKIGETALITRGLVTSKSIFEGEPDTAGPNTTKPDPWADKPRMNVLLIGSDAGADRTGIRPDTLILASIDTKTGNTVLFSLPRSLQRAPFAPGTPGAVAWPDGYWCPDQSCLLNAIWTWGDDAPGYAKYKRPGLQATRDAVEGITGLKVDNYLMLNLSGFRDFVDAIGKVTVDVHTRLPIGGNGDEHSPLYHVATGGWIEVGKNQKLDGYHALWFARSRWATDDYDRMQRQRCMIGAVVERADPVTLAKNFSSVAKALKKNISTGIATSQLDAWVELSQRVKGATVTSLPFTNDVISTVNPDIPRIHELVQNALTASLEPTAAPTPQETPSPSASAKPKKKKANPTKAQDLSAVC
jgi:LCP family protein required for cell wall assembly